MRAISIVCDSCGHHAADAPGRRDLVVASTDRLHDDTPSPPRYGLPSHCPCCGAEWDLFHPGDEFLIGLSRVAHTRPRNVDATRS